MRVASESKGSSMAGFEAFKLSREALAYKRNLITSSAAVILIKFLSITPSALPLFGNALKSVGLMPLNFVYLGVVAYFGGVFFVAAWRDRKEWDFGIERTKTIEGGLMGYLTEIFAATEFVDGEVENLSKAQNRMVVKTYFKDRSLVADDKQISRTYLHILALRQEDIDRNNFIAIQKRTSRFNDFLIPAAFGAISTIWVIVDLIRAGFAFAISP